MTMTTPGDGGLPAYPVANEPPQYPVAPLYPAAASGYGSPAPGYEYASFGWRLLGWVIDRLLLTAIALILYIPLLILPLADYLKLHPVAAGQTLVVPTDLAGRVIVISLVTTFIEVLYFGGLVAWQGRTFGQRILGMHVVRQEDGGRLPVGRALARSVFFWGPGLTGLVPFLGLVGVLVELIAFLAVLWDRRRQGWHDKVGRSLVIRRARGYS